MVFALDGKHGVVGLSALCRTWTAVWEVPRFELRSLLGLVLVVVDLTLIASLHFPDLALGPLIHLEP